MAKTDYRSADEYIATFPAEKRAILEEVRAAIRKAVPGAEEVISYQIPAFRLNGGWIFYYSMYAAHYSLACPPPFAAFKEFAKELSQYKQSKSAVNFPLDEPVPVDLIARMSRFQADDFAARAGEKGKPASRPKAGARAGAESGSRAKAGNAAKAGSRRQAKAGPGTASRSKADPAGKAKAKPVGKNISKTGAASKARTRAKRA